MRTKNAKLRFFSFLCGEKDKEEDGEFLRRRRGRKKKVKSGDEGEQETNKQKKTDLQISLFFPATSPLFSERKKKKKA